MLRHAIIAIKLILIMVIILGFIYPLTVTGIAQVVFSKQANGSLVKQKRKIIGSELIRQSFSESRYFHPRPSAAIRPKDKTAQDVYVSGGSNLAPTSKKLIDRITSDIVRLKKENSGLKPGKIPVDMVTTSGSGLDPDISPANAYAQIPRVAKARGISKAELTGLVRSQIISRQFGVLGEPRINVLKLNITLDGMSGK